METVVQTQTILPIFQKIHEVRGLKVMLDFDLAALYGVQTRTINQATKRNTARFPLDFMFQLTKEEWFSIQKSQFVLFHPRSVDSQEDRVLRSQTVISKQQYSEDEENRGGNRYLPYAFTEQGIAMLSSVLRSERAIEVNIAIMRVFVEMRKLFLNHQDLIF